jgi:hypothetical protein
MQAKLNFLPVSANVLLVLLFEPENGCDVLLQNISLYPNCVALQLRGLIYSISV